MTEILTKEDFKERLFQMDNHKLGCLLECYSEVLSYRVGYEKEARQLEEIASRLK